MKKFLILTAVSLLLLFSCNDDPSIKNSSGEGENDLTTRKFWAQNLKNDRFYQVNAELFAEGIWCNVWVEKNSGVSESTARSIANTYDNDIYDKMINTFGEKNIEYDGQFFSNTMTFADAVTNEDGKLCILVLDIKDDYQEGVYESYVSGYFWAGNLYDYDPEYPITMYSNLCDMIYIDSNPGIPNSKESNTTLAHEMQHLMNFLSSVLHREFLMDTWIDEGLSGAAEWVYSEEYSEGRWKWFNGNGYGEQMKGLIDKGNNFYVWDNRSNENQYAVLDDYATVYLFFQWLRLQSGSTSIYKDIISSSDYDYRAVTNAAKTKIDANYNTWDLLLKDWMAANYINSISGRYGYIDDPELSQIKAPAISSNETTVSLYPGEGVYSITNSEPIIPPGSSGNIKYSYLTTLPSDSFSKDSTLLTYNSNTVNYNEYDENGVLITSIEVEQGVITGVVPPPSSSVNISDGRFVRAPLSGPFPIGAGDVLRRKGKGDSFYIKDFKALKADAVNE